MNNQVEDSDGTKATTIRRLNDELRRSFIGGAVMLTPSVIALGSKAQKAIVAKVRV